jgi:predicted nucleic acid-binding protein
MYLLDTNAISELRRASAGRADPRVTAWGLSVSTQSLFLSVVTIFELKKGILSKERRDPAQGALLRQWLSEDVLVGFAGRILPVDLDVATRCAALHVPTTRPERDAWIAATALVHGMTVVTRNVADFEPMGAAVLNPWEWQS